MPGTKPPKIYLTSLTETVLEIRKTNPIIEYNLYANNLITLITPLST